MTKKTTYDDFAEIYDVWVESAPVTVENRDFYVELLVASEGPRAELGVGNGRICIEVAKSGREIYGVDSSERMLALCRERADSVGVADKLHLVHSDFREFELPEPAELITIPFHTIGHLLTDEDKRKALSRVRSQLRGGGRLVFDHFIFDPDYPVPPGIPHLRADFTHPGSGRRCLLWDTTTRDHERKVLGILVCTEELDDAGAIVDRRYRTSQLSWIEPRRMRELIEKAGLEVEALSGGFSKQSFEDGDPHQIWTCRKR
jgi:ubiquinone/menaquinone biosynthesis C-methylase UbiE